MNYFECEPQGRGWHIGGKIHATWDGTKTKCGRRIGPDWWVSRNPFLEYLHSYRYCEACIKVVATPVQATPPVQQYCDLCNSVKPCLCFVPSTPGAEWDD